MNENDETQFKTPGQYISFLMAQKGWNNRVLSVVLGKEETGISKIVQDKKPVTAETALILGEVFNVEPMTFLTLQYQYDLAKAKITTIPDKKRNTRAHLYGGLPVPVMIKRGWLDVDNIKDTEATETALKKFFFADSIDEIEILPHAAKKTLTSEATTPAQLAWLYRVRKIASEMIVNEFSQFKLKGLLEKLRLLTSAAEEARKVPRLLAEAGIRFVIVESLPSAKIDGVCFWLNETSPVIALTLRFDRIDNFWFVLRHELEHVIQGHGKSRISIDCDIESSGSNNEIDNEERIANEAAAEFCVPQKLLDAFVARKAPTFADRDILNFASMLKVHPGLIAGQLRRRINRYDRFVKHLVKIRYIVSPSAVVDGWGDIVEVDYEE